MEIAWLGAQFDNFMAEIAESTNLKGYPHPFGHVVYITTTAQGTVVSMNTCIVM
jgi:hypothetical protein